MQLLVSLLSTRHFLRQLPTLVDEEAHLRFATRVGRFSTVFFISVSVLFFVCVHILDLPYFAYQVLHVSPRYVIGDLLLLAVPYGVLILDRYIAFPLSSKLRGTEMDRRTYMLLGYRRLAVFVLPQAFYFTLVRVLLFNWPGLAEWIEGHPTVFLAVMATYVFLFFMLSPMMVRFLFPRVPLAQYSSDPRAAELAERLRRLAERAGQRAGEIYIWDCQGLPFANAVVTGVLSGYRHFYLSDFLLAQLSLEEVEAVFAHEMGHVHFRHLLYNYLLSISLTLFLIWGGWALGPLMESHTSASLGVMGLVLFYFLFVFRRFLNRFELQADLFAVRLLGEPFTFQRVLLRLAELNLTSTSRRSVTHPSIDQRVSSLAELEERESMDARMRVETRWNHRTLALFALVLIATLFLLERAGIPA